MNRTDEQSVVTAIKAILAEAGGHFPVIAFDVSRLSTKVRNTRLKYLIDEVNEVLSSTSVCRELEGIYTVCEYEMSTAFLVQADLTVSVSPGFDPSTKVMKKLGPTELAEDEEGEDEDGGSEGEPCFLRVKKVPRKIQSKL